MWRRISSEMVTEAWKLVVDEGLSRAAAAKRLGISERRADRIINAIHSRRGNMADRKSPVVEPIKVRLERRMRSKCP